MGRLIEADRLKEVFSRNVVGGNAYFDLIDNAPTVEAIPKADYENRLKADMVAMLRTLQFEIEEMEMEFSTEKEIWNNAIGVCSDRIQQRINSLKE